MLTITHSPYSDDGRIRGSSHLWGGFDGRLHAEGDKERLTGVLTVDRFKEHESLGQWGFTFDKVEVEEHPGEFSLVPRLDSEVKPSKAKAKGKENTHKIVEREFLNTYDRLADGVAKVPGFDGNPVAKVSTDAIREEMKSRGALELLDNGNLTRAASTLLWKAKVALTTDGGALAEKDKLIWRK